MMKLHIQRSYKGQFYTIGDLFVNGSYLCNTLEDTVRLLTIEKKIPGKTAIPAGKYNVIVNKSPKFKRDLPRLLDVPHFEGVLIHRGNLPEHTEGCILVGENKVKGKVINSTKYELILVELLKDAQNRGEQIEIEIQ